MNRPILIFVPLAFGVFLLLGLAAFPTLDDYGFMTEFREFDLFDKVSHLYQTHNGRYFQVTFIGYVMSTIAKQFDPFTALDAYHALPILVIAAFFLPLRALARSMGYGDNRFPRGWVSFGVLCLILIYFIHMPRPASGLYWASGAFGYHTGTILFLLILSSLFNFGRTTSPARFIYALIAIVCTVCAIGTNEILIFFLGTSLFFGTLISRRMQSPSAWLWLTCLITAILCLPIPFLSPAMWNRMEVAQAASSTETFQLIPAIIDSIHWSGRYYLSWVCSPLLLVSSLILLPFAAKVVDGHHFFQKVRIHHWLLAMILLPGVIWFSWFIPAAVGLEMPKRAANQVYFIFLVLWFTQLHLFVAAWINRGVKTRFERLSTARIMPILFILACFVPGDRFLLPPNNLLTGIYSLTGPAWSYRNSYTERFEQVGNALDTGAKDVYWKPLQSKPKLLFFGDIIDQPDSWQNGDIARYFGFEKLYLQPTEKP
ncbi:MAG: hypothetical protein HQL54_05020 [Magnetococcales bacterium]|nr:hypothetical protein [Magnetococcales bacterium]